MKKLALINHLTMITHQKSLKRKSLVKTKKIVAFYIIILSFFTASSQLETITYESNGKTSLIQSENPFYKFFGEWTLKNDYWTQNWGGNTETIKIPKHHTISAAINTKNSLFSIIDGPEPNGHIFWSYNPNTKEVFHLSSFGNIREGHGKGSIDNDGNIKLKLKFEGESKDTYRIYSYTWLSDDEYHMKSIQFDENDKPTGLFYEGNFIRIESEQSLRAEIQNILSTLDNNKITKEEQIKVYSRNIVHMAPNQELIDNKADLLAYLNEQAAYGLSDMKHSIMEFSEHGDVVIMRGQVNGTFYRKGNDKGIAFRTKNLFVFERVGGVLKITKVIYNRSPDN